MAKGKNQATGAITSNTDTTVVAAPDANESIYILWFTTTVAGVWTTTGSATLTEGASGPQIARMSLLTLDNILNINYATVDRNTGGRKLAPGTALVITTSGGAAGNLRYDIGYEVR